MYCEGTADILDAHGCGVDTHTPSAADSLRPRDGTQCLWAGLITSLSESEMVSSILKPPWRGFSVLVSVWDCSQMRTFLEPANELILYLGLSLRPLPWILRLRLLLEPGPCSTDYLPDAGPMFSQHVAQCCENIQSSFRYTNSLFGLLLVSKKCWLKIFLKIWKFWKK